MSQLQHQLRQSGAGWNLQQTGVYDAATVAAVTQFQTAYNVHGDPAGVYGPNSQAMMQQLVAWHVVSGSAGNSQTQGQGQGQG